MKISFKNKVLARTLEPVSRNYWGCKPRLLKPECFLEPALCSERSDHNEEPEHCPHTAIKSSLLSCRSVVSDSLRPHGLQHTRPPCPSPTPGACSNSCPLSQWCHPTICLPLHLLPSVFPNIRFFSKEPALHIWWPKYWSFSISPSNEHLGLISFSMDWLDLLAVQGTLKSLLQHHTSKASILLR